MLWCMDDILSVRKNLAFHCNSDQLIISAS